MFKAAFTRTLDASRLKKKTAEDDLKTTLQTG